jgi:hypothetical protein
MDNMAITAQLASLCFHRKPGYIDTTYPENGMSAGSAARCVMTRNCWPAALR